jgi:hypothetical protein
VESDGGSPILAGANVVISGNGRSFILRAVDKDGRYKTDYLDKVARWAEQRGIDAPPPGMTKPVLVRRITSAHSKEELQKIAELSNRMKILQRSEAETAEADAKLLTPEMMAAYQPGADGNLLAASNAPFMQLFIRKAGGEGATDSKGRADATLAARVQNAMLAAVIGTDMQARELIRALLERDPKASLGSLYNSILAVAGMVIDNDNVNPKLAIRPWLQQAVRDYIGWRTSAPEMTLDDILAQQDMLAGTRSPETQALMRIIKDGRLTAVMTSYVEQARKEGGNTGSLFEDFDRTPLQVLAIADRLTLQDGQKPATPEPDQAAAMSTKPPEAVVVEKVSEQAQAEQPSLLDQQPEQEEKDFTEEAAAPDPMLETYAPTAYNPEPTPEGQGEAWDRIGLGPKKIPYENTKGAGLPWSRVYPTFQGGKKKMADRTTAVIHRTMTKAERDSYTHVVDHFGGSGAWGLFNALKSFTKATRLTIREFNPNRAMKIQFMMTKGNQFQDHLERAMPIFSEAIKAASEDGNASGSAISARIDAQLAINQENREDVIAVATAISDYLNASFGAKEDESGQKTPEAKLDMAVRIVTEQAATMYDMAQEFRKRGGTIDPVATGSSYDAKPFVGANVVSIIDPPYYLTKGYDSWKVTQDLLGTRVEKQRAEIVGTDIYKMTRDLINNTAQAGNAIIYTDEAFWLKKDYEASLRPTKEEKQEDQQILLDISNALDYFGEAGKVADRTEVMGVNHGHTTEQTEAQSGTQAAGYNDPMGGRQAGRPDALQGADADLQQPAVQSMAGGDAGSAETLRSGSDSVNQQEMRLQVTTTDRPRGKGNFDAKKTGTIGTKIALYEIKPGGNLNTNIFDRPVFSQSGGMVPVLFDIAKNRLLVANAGRMDVDHSNITAVAIGFDDPDLSNVRGVLSIEDAKITWYDITSMAELISDAMGTTVQEVMGRIKDNEFKATDATFYLNGKKIKSAFTPIDDPIEDIRFQVTAEQDAEYMEAAEAGDLEAAQQMVDEAALKAGYNVGPVYHGTGRWGEDRQFTVFESRQMVHVYKVDDNVVKSLDSAGESLSDFEDPQIKEGYHYGALADAADMGAEKALEMRRKDEPANSPHIRDLEKLVGKKVRSRFEEMKTGSGFYFSGNENYGIVSRSRHKIKAYLKIQNPAILDETTIERAGTWYNKKNLIKQGYDGAINSLGNQKYQQVVVFNPEQIKSAEPIQRDDKGNIIPLSQRFNSATADIRFQVTATRQDQTATPEFNQWFSDSKVTNDDGTPKVVYHGSRAEFNTFDISKSEDKLGVFFADRKTGTWGEEREFFISMQNPLVVNQGDDYRAKMITGETQTQLRKRLQKEGYDGIIMKYYGGLTDYIAFKPTQIKSATDNRGTFDGKDPDIRHQVTAFGNALNTPEAIATAAYAYDIALSGKAPSEQAVSKLLREIGANAQPQEIIKQAKKYATQIDPRTEEAVARIQDRRIIDQLADQADRDLYVQRQGVAFERGQQSMAALPRVAEGIEKARQRTAKLAIESAEGIKEAKLSLDLGIDLSQALLNTPDIQLTAEEKERREAARQKALLEAEQALLDMEEREEVEPVPPTPEMLALLDELLKEAEIKTEADKAEAERKRLEDEQAAKLEAEKAAKDADEDGEDQEEAAPAAPAEPAKPDPVYELMAPVIESPLKWVNFIYAYATRKISAQRPHLDPKKLYKDPAALRDLQRTFQHVLAKLASDHLRYGKERLAAQRDISHITDNYRVASTLKDALYIYSRIHANALRISREEMVDDLEREVRKLAIDGKKFQEAKRDEKRKITAKVEKYARTLISYLRLNQNQIAAETDRLKAIINGATSNDTDITKAQADAIDQLAVLSTYGGMIHWMPGQISEVSAMILDDLDGKREAFELQREERDAAARKTASAIAQGIMQDNPEAPRPDMTRGQRFFDSMLGNLQQRLENLLRFNKDSKKRATAMTSIEDVMNEVGQGAQQHAIVTLDGHKWLNKTLKEIYGGDLKGIRHLDEKIPATVTLPNGTTVSTAQISRHGNQLTYGQAIQLYGSILQTWYQENVRIHGRHKDLPVLEAILSDKDMRLHQAMVQYYKDNRAKLSDAQQRITGMPILTPDPLYIPARMLIPTEGAGGRHIAWTPIVKHLSPRVRNRLDFNEDVSILDTFATSLEDTALLTAYGERGIWLVKTLLSQDVLGSTDRFHGSAAMQALRSQVEDVLRAGASLVGSDAAHTGAAIARRWAARFGLSGNIASALKQTASVPVWASVVGFRNLGKYMSTVASEEGRLAIRELMESDGFRARYEGGWSAESADILSQQHVSWLGKLYDKGLAPNRFVDAVAAIWIAQGLYRDLKAKYIDQGMAPDEAKKRAQTITWNLVEQTQQSGRQENLPRFIREGGQLARFITQFQLSPLQQMAFELTAIREVRAGTPGAKAKLLRVMIINHLLIPSLLLGIQEGWNMLLGSEPPDEDQLKSKLPEAIAAAIMGQFSALWIIGAMGTDGIATLLGAKPRYGSSEAVPAAGVARASKQAAETVKTVAQLLWNLGVQPSDMFDVTTEDLLKDLDRLMDQVSAPWRHGSAAAKNYTEDK